MYFKNNPFEGLDTLEICRKIYSPNLYYEEDAEEITRIVGGESNGIATERVKSDKANAKLIDYRIKVKDIKETEFTKQQVRTILVSGSCILKLEKDNSVIISTNGVIAQGLNYLIKERK